MSTERIVNVATAVVALCAVVMTGLLVKRELSADSRNGSIPPGPTVQKDWKDYTKSGHAIGQQDAKVSIVEFADFQCPYCRRFVTYTDSLQKLGRGVRVLFRHYPL